MKFSYNISDFNYYISFAYVISAVLIFLVIRYFARKAFIRLILLSIMLISSAYYIFHNRTWIINRAVSDFNIINDNISKSQAIVFKNFYIILIILIPLVITALFLYSRKIYTSIIFLTLSFVLFLWYTGYTEEIKEYLFKYSFLNVFTLVVINYIKSRKIFREKDVKVRTSIFSLLIYGIILSVIFSAIVSILPKEYYGRLNSNSYSYFENKYEKSKEFTSEYKKYNISYSGYNDSGISLGGPIKLDNGKALEVYGGNFLYLRGDAKDFYTGNSWLSKINSYRNDNKNVIDNQELKRYFSITTVIIKPIGLITSTVFVPPHAVMVYNKSVYADNYGCFLRESPYNTEYTVSYYDGIKMIDDYKGMDFKSNGKKDDFVQGTNYLQVPDTVPKEVYDLVHDIIEKDKAVTDYDKVISLKKYLEKNYKYTLNTKELTGREDFVDNFLFKEKQGYCTYFASALAIMCRIAGVPAIYVEGFKQSGSPIVTNNMAHAWVEVNLTNDHLWLIADPTPIADRNNIEDINNPQTDNNNLPINNIHQNTNNNKNQNITDTEKAAALSKNKVITIIIILVLILLIFSKVIFIVFRKRNLIYNKSIIPLMFYSIKRIRILGTKKGEAEGFLEYSERITDKELKENMVLLSKCYYNEAFGNKKDEIDKNRIYKFIEDKIRKEKGLIKYYLDKILKF